MTKLLPHRRIRPSSLALAIRFTAAVRSGRINQSLRKHGKNLTQRLFWSENWNTYGAEPPNHIARQIGAKILDMLERASLTPARLTPSAEGGIALSFVNNHKRAVIEIYNTGELAAATYSLEGEPEVWELEASDDPIVKTVDQIRVYLAA